MEVKVKPYKGKKKEKASDVVTITAIPPDSSYDAEEAVRMEEIGIIKEHLMDPMIYGKNITPFMNDAMEAINEDMLLPIEKGSDVNSQNYLGANQFRAAILFDGDEAKGSNLVHTAGIFASPDDGFMWCKIRSTEEGPCYLRMPEMPMLFGTAAYASGVFVPFGCSDTGVRNAHMMIDAFCSPISRTMFEIGVSPMALLGMIGQSGVKYPGDDGSLSLKADIPIPIDGD